MSAPAVANAADDSLDLETLRKRYDTDCHHMRKVVKELAERCGYTVSPRPARS